MDFADGRVGTRPGGNRGSIVLATLMSTRRSRAGIGSIVLALVFCVSGCASVPDPTGLGPTDVRSNALFEEHATIPAQPTLGTFIDEKTASAISHNPKSDFAVYTSRNEGNYEFSRIVPDPVEDAIATEAKKDAGNIDPVVGTAMLARARGYKADPAVQVALLQPDPSLAESYAAAGIDLVTLELGWDAYQPTATTTNRSYVAKRVAEARAYTDAGLEVVLDLGLQYTPAWAWALPGETRFTNQYGEQWHGEIGTDALDAVWNSTARQAEGTYVGLVARDFAGLVDRVRVGGLLSGELRLPPAHAAGHVDSLWAFGEGALAASPDPTWRPGSGTAAQARRWLDFYMSSVSRYAVWLTQTVGSAFPATPIDVLLPGWGVRPGDLERVAADRVSTGAVVSTGDDLASGLDWPRQIRALDRLALDLTVVTTWLDAPSYGAAPRDLAPVEYLATLTRPLAMPLSGENTGGGGAATLERVREQAKRLELGRITWMPDRDPGTLGGVTLGDLGAAFPDRAGQASRSQSIQLGTAFSLSRSRLIEVPGSAPN